MPVGTPRFRKCFETAEICGLPADSDTRTPRAALTLHPDGVAHVPLIMRLLVSRSPAAVFRRVISIVVQSIERICRRRPRPHVGQERHKIALPAVAHADAAAAIAG